MEVKFTFLYGIYFVSGHSKYLLILRITISLFRLVTKKVPGERAMKRKDWKCHLFVFNFTHTVFCWFQMPFSYDVSLSEINILYSNNMCRNRGEENLKSSNILAVTPHRWGIWSSETWWITEVYHMFARTKRRTDRLTWSLK